MNNSVPKQFGFSIKIHDAILYNECLKVLLINDSELKFNPTIYGLIDEQFYMQGNVNKNIEILLDLNFVNAIEIIGKNSDYKTSVNKLQKVIFIRKKQDN